MKFHGKELNLIRNIDFQIGWEEKLGPKINILQRKKDWF